MDTRNLLADISREFFKYKKVYSYKMKKVTEMSDSEVISYCHWFCEDNGIVEEFINFRKKTESEYYFCSFMEEFIEPGCCYDMQMFAEGFEQEGNTESYANKAELKNHCLNCSYGL